MKRNYGTSAFIDTTTSLPAEVNHLSHFLLTQGLWPLLQTAAERITKPRNPRHFDTIEGGRVHHTFLVTIESVKGI